MCNEEISLVIISPRDLTSLWHRNTYSKNGKDEGNYRDWRHADGFFDLEITVLATEFDLSVQKGFGVTDIPYLVIRKYSS